MKTVAQQVRLSEFQKPMDQVRRETRQHQEAADRYARAWEKREKEQRADARQRGSS